MLHLLEKTQLTLRPKDLNLAKTEEHCNKKVEYNSDCSIDFGLQVGDFSLIN